MQVYLAVATMILLITLVLFRVSQLRKVGIKAMRFGEMDKKGLIIPPFALLLFYVIFSNAFNWPRVGADLFDSKVVGWIGVVLCILGLSLFFYSLISFRKFFIKKKTRMKNEHH